MAIEKIEYQNKEAIDDVGVPEKNKVTAENMNEIKSVVNTNADEMEDADNALSDRIDEVSSAVNNIVENTYTKTETNNLLSSKADKSEIPTKVSDLDNDEGFIDNTVNNLENYTLTQDLAEVATSGSYNDLSNTPTIPTKTSDLTNDSGFIDKNVNNLTNYTLKTNTGSLIDLEINQSNYVVSLSLKDIDGNVISSDNIDLPLESVVVGGSYDATNKKIVLTLENGNTVDIPVGDLIAGLQTEITSQNKLASDLVDDSNSGNKFVTTTEKNTWNAKYDKPSGGIPKTDLASDVQTSLGKADTALQEHQDISGKANKISVVQTSTSTIEINSNTFYKFGEVASLNITLASITDNTIYNEYMFEFVSGSTATTLTLPSSIKWLETPTIDANKIYQCSIVDNVGLLVGVANV